jgi:RNAPII transcription regulator C-terminal
MPLLLRGLDLPDVNMRIDVIKTLQSTAQDDATSGETVQAAVSEHAASLVTAMLKNSRALEQSSSVGFLDNAELLVADDVIASAHGFNTVFRYPATSGKV